MGKHQSRFHNSNYFTTVPYLVKGIPQRKQPRDGQSRYWSEEEDPAFGPWPVGKQVGVLAGCCRNPGWTGKPLEVPLFVLQKWGR